MVVQGDRTDSTREGTTACTGLVFSNCVEAAPSYSDSLSIAGAHSFTKVRLLDWHHLKDGRAFQHFMDVDGQRVVGSERY
jgi:hypothetical protein